jgi:hypothetical protein
VVAARGERYDVVEVPVGANRLATEPEHVREGKLGRHAAAPRATTQPDENHDVRLCIKNSSGTAWTFSNTSRSS